METERINPKYYPPSAVVIRNACNQLIRLKNFQHFITRAAFYLLFLISLYTLVFSNRSPMSYMSNKAIKDMVITGAYGGRLSLGDVSKVADMWSYLEDTFIPCLNGTTTAASFSADSVNMVLGVAQLRQFRRVKRSTCVVPATFSHIYKKSCFNAFSNDEEDTQSYGVSWTLTNTSFSGRQWIYTESGQASIMGKYFTYNSGGFSKVLEGETEFLQSTVQLMKNQGWVDSRTVAVIAEVNLYNPSLNLVNAVTILFEFQDIGGIETFYDIMTLLPIDSSVTIQITVALSAIMYVIFVFMFIIWEIKRILWVLNEDVLHEDIWVYIELSIIILSISCFVAVIMRIQTLNSVMETCRTNVESKFIDFYLAGYWDLSFMYLSGSLLVMVVLKFIRILQFSTRILMLSAVLRKAVPDMLAFFFYTTCAFIAYLTLAMAFLGSECVYFSTISKTLMTMFTLVLRKSKFNGERDCSSYTSGSVTGPMFFMLCGSFMIIIIVPLSQSILIYATKVTRRDAKEKLQEEIEMLHDVKVRLLMLFGCGPDEPPAHKFQEEAPRQYHF